jgi:hypothetical protein
MMTPFRGFGGGGSRQQSGFGGNGGGSRQQSGFGGNGGGFGQQPMGQQNTDSGFGSMGGGFGGNQQGGGGFGGNQQGGGFGGGFNGQQGFGGGFGQQQQYNPYQQQQQYNPYQQQQQYNPYQQQQQQYNPYQQRQQQYNPYQQQQQYNPYQQQQQQFNPYQQQQQQFNPYQQFAYGQAAQGLQLETGRGGVNDLRSLNKPSESALRELSVGSGNDGMHEGRMGTMDLKQGYQFGDGGNDFPSDSMMGTAGDAGVAAGGGGSQEGFDALKNNGMFMPRPDSPNGMSMPLLDSPLPLPAQFPFSPYQQYNYGGQEQQRQQAFQQAKLARNPYLSMAQ